MLLLTSTSDIVRVVTGSAADIEVHASWMDHASAVVTPGRTNTASITTATTTTVVAAPAAATQRNVKYLSIFNNHATASTLVTVEHFDGTTAEVISRATLLPGEGLDFTQEGRWLYFDSAGSEKLSSRLTQVLTARSTATVSAAFAADTYLAGSAITMPAAAPVVGTTYHLIFDMVKTGAGTATPILILRYGTAGSTADTARVTFTFAVGTAVIDTGTFEVWAHFRTVGSGTSAVVVGVCQCRHSLAATGLTSTGASGMGQLSVVSGGFDSTIAGSILGASFNGGGSFSGTCTLVEAQAYTLST